MSLFKPAEKSIVPLKIAIAGPAGGGKTYSALTLASVIGKRIALIDTENRSASLYAKKFKFDTAGMGPPFDTERYIKAIAAAAEAKYDVLIIDTISHAWAGTGGLLEQKEILDRKPGSNHYTNWGSITKKHEAFLSAILQSPIDIICTMRSKTDYVLVERNGKQAPQKVGLAPVQREGVDYEFSVVFDVDKENYAEASKDRTGLFRERRFIISSDIGKELLQWRNDGGAMAESESSPPLKEGDFGYAPAHA